MAQALDNRCHEWQERERLGLQMTRFRSGSRGRGLMLQSPSHPPLPRWRCVIKHRHPRPPLLTPPGASRVPSLNLTVYRTVVTLCRLLLRLVKALSFLHIQANYRQPL